MIIEGEKSFIGHRCHENQLRTERPACLTQIRRDAVAAGRLLLQTGNRRRLLVVVAHLRTARGTFDCQFHGEAIVGRSTFVKKKKKTFIQIVFFF